MRSIICFLASMTLVVLAQAGNCVSLALYKEGVIYADGGSIMASFENNCQKINVYKFNASLKRNYSTFYVDEEKIKPGSKLESTHLKRLDVIVGRASEGMIFKDFKENQLKEMLNDEGQVNLLPVIALIENVCQIKRSFDKNKKLCEKYLG